MGVLVRTAQSVEDRVHVARQRFEPKFRVKMQEARTEWLELKSGKRGPLSAGELRARGFLLRADAKVRMRVDLLIGRTIVELERVRRKVARAS